MDYTNYEHDRSVKTVYLKMDSAKETQNGNIKKGGDMNIRIIKETLLMTKLSEYANNLKDNNDTIDNFVEYTSKIASEIVDILKPYHFGNVMPSEYIVCSAIHYDDNRKHYHQPDNIETGFVIAGLRHHNCFYTIATLKGETIKGMKETQGFLTNDNRFLDREDAGKLAFTCGQIKEKVSTLFSEDIY